MGKKIWKFELDRWEHKVEIETGFLAGVKQIYLDGIPIEKNKENTFQIRDHTLRIDIRDSLVSSEYNLLIDGLLVEGGQELSARTSTSDGIPGWTWIFVVACGIMPIITLGGCVPGAIGFGGAGACFSVARNKTISTGLRIVLCIFITVVSWGIFGVFAWQFAVATIF